MVRKSDISNIKSGFWACSHKYQFSKYCGVEVCVKCNYHRGLVRCFCGYSLTSPGSGRRELEEMGEVIEDE